MSAKSATLAKSLHTVSVIVAIARELSSTGAAPMDSMTAVYYVGRALSILGYTFAADPHMLAEKARVQLVKGAQ